jgi:flagellar biogenesis protein FliO
MSAVDLNVWSFFAEILGSDAPFAHSLFTVLIFLSVLGFGGYVVIRFCRRGGFSKTCAAVDESKRIKILDNKFLYGRKYITLVECCGRRLLILVNRDDAVKLGEWEAGIDEVDR